MQFNPRNTKYAKEDQGESVIKRAELRSPKDEQQRKRKTALFCSFSRGLRISRFLQLHRDGLSKRITWRSIL